MFVLADRRSWGVLGRPVGLGFGRKIVLGGLNSEFGGVLAGAAVGAGRIIISLTSNSNIIILILTMLLMIITGERDHGYQS